mgnify:CR=1 FL=1
MQIFLGESLRKVSYRLRAAQLHGQIVNKFHFSCVIFVSLAGGLSFVPCLVCASGSVCLLQDRWKPEKLKKDNAYLHRLIDANIEGYRAIRNAGHEILPDADKEFEGATYRKTYFCFFKLMCATALVKICASDHAMNAVDEMSALNQDMKVFFVSTGAEYPVWQALEAEAGRYL